LESIAESFAMPGTFKIVGEFWFNLSDLTLWRGQEYIQVTPKACAILRELVERPGEIFTHEQLLEAVWPETYVQPEVLKVHMFELRRALGDDPRRPRYIETIPRRGHRLIASVHEAQPGPIAGGPAGAREPLPGRGRAMQRLMTGLGTASQGVRQLVFVTGEPGMGKTALIESFSAGIRSISGAHLAAAQCLRIHTDGEPYDPILDILRILSNSGFHKALERYAPAWLTLLAQVSPGAGREKSTPHRAASPRRMLREICDFLQAISQETTLVIIIEDIHWADAGTAGFLSAVALREQPANLIMICSFRPAELTLAKLPLRALVGELKLKKLCREVALEPLNEAGVTDLLAAELPGAAVPGHLGRLFTEYSGGNPLYVSVIARHLRENSNLRATNGIWTLDVKEGESHLVLPQSTQDLLLSRFDSLSVEQRRLLEDAALVGPRFSIWALSVVSEMPEPEVEAECEAFAGESGILRSAGMERLPAGLESAQFEFRLKLHSEALARRVEPARRVRAHKRLAERIEAVQGDATEERTGELAWHYEQARDWEKAVLYFELAAGQRLRRQAPRDAAALFSRAKDLAARLANTERREELQLGLPGRTALAWSASGQLDRAFEAWQELIDLALKSGRREMAVEAALESSPFRMILNYRQALQMAEWALSLSKALDNAVLMARAQLERSHLRLALERWSQHDLARAESAVARLRTQRTHGKTAYFDAVRASIQNLRSDYEAALAATSNATGLFAGRVFRHALLYLGRWGELYKNAEEAVTAAEERGDRLGSYSARVDRAMLLVECCNFDRALEELDAASGETASSYQLFRHEAAAVRALAYAGTGKYEQALKAAAECRQPPNEPAFSLHRVMADRATVEAQLGLSDLDAALESAQTLLSFVSKTEERTWQALAWYWLARVYQSRREAVAARAAIDSGVELIRSFNLPLVAWHVHALAGQIYSDQKQLAKARAFSESAASAIAHLASTIAEKASIHEAFYNAAMQECALTQDISGR
jgi:DNA-binding winged helix-turn-helix (wHTH) protein/tetratricopeptide (TPR) repeat protein